MALEETPWLQQARGGAEEPDDLINVLDPRSPGPSATRRWPSCEKAQTSLGGFPWWPGGPPSPYMTLYILHGFSKALEFGVEVPKDVVVTGLVLHAPPLHRRAGRADDGARTAAGSPSPSSTTCSRTTPTTRWTGGVFTDDERERMLDFSFSHWKRALAAAQGLPGPDPRARRAVTTTPCWSSTASWTRPRPTRTWAPSGRPRTAPGSGTTTPSRPTPSPCAP